MLLRVLSFIVAIATPHSCPPECTGICDSFPSQPLGTCSSFYLSDFSSNLGACWNRRMHNLQLKGERGQWLNGTTSPAPSGMLLRHSAGRLSGGLQKFSPRLQPELARCLMLCCFLSFSGSHSSLSSRASWAHLPGNLPARKPLS